MGSGLALRAHSWGEGARLRLSAGLGGAITGSAARAAVCSGATWWWEKHHGAAQILAATMRAGLRDPQGMQGRLPSRRVAVGTREQKEQSRTKQHSSRQYVHRTSRPDRTPGAVGRARLPGAPTCSSTERPGSPVSHSPCTQEVTRDPQLLNVQRALCEMPCPTVANASILGALRAGWAEPGHSAGQE